MARRTMAERKRRTAEREQRRDTLLVLLSRMQRGALLDAERPLLQAHVEAELSDADELRSTVAGQQTLIQRQAAQLDAAHAAIEETEREHGRAEIRCATAEQRAADLAEQLRMYRAAYGPDGLARAGRIRDAYDRARRLSAVWRQAPDAVVQSAGYELDAVLDNAPTTPTPEPQQ
ncbi:hypothetical protein ACFRQM_04435 [Streptomyces sp. NPDC056831]|uniref:hypothetical protein n=1 Tax=Streptomyces sp. NPDC056831 TaxID=3345954 RepID=UPI0036B55001